MTCVLQPERERKRGDRKRERKRERERERESKREREREERERERMAMLNTTFKKLPAFGIFHGKTDNSFLARLNSWVYEY